MRNIKKNREKDQKQGGWSNVINRNSRHDG